MKKWFLLFLVLALNSSLTVEAKGKSKKEQDIRKLLNIMGYQTQSSQTLDLILNSYRKNGVDPVFLDQFKKKLNSSELYEMAVPVYDRNLEHEDIKAMINFYESPAGKRILNAMPIIQREGYIQGEAYGRKVGNEIMEGLANEGGQGVNP